MEAKSPAASTVEMNELVLPPHTNSLGSVFGGVILSWIDVCGAMCAQRHACGSVVTASMDQIDFLAPIKLGQQVSLRASVNYVGRTSMEVGVRVEVVSVQTAERVHSASAYVTFVAVDENGLPQEVPPLEPQTKAEQLRWSEAKMRRRQRFAIAEERRRMAKEHWG